MRGRYNVFVLVRLLFETMAGKLRICPVVGFTLSIGPNQWFKYGKKINLF